ncbi:TetR/AcrR family transcriptional regulator [Parasphingorhabdus pacifica]
MTTRPRRLDYSDSTRQALVDSAVELFTERGYGATSLDEVARRARVTKGALYHHFAGKKALFEAAYDALEASVAARLAASGAETADRWESTRARLRAFLEVCLEAEYQRIVVHEGPVVLGGERNSEERFTFGMVREAVTDLVESGEVEPLPVDSLTRVVFGALSAGASTIAESSDPQRTRAEVGQCVERLMDGLRV